VPPASFKTGKAASIICSRCCDWNSTSSFVRLLPQVFRSRCVRFLGIALCLFLLFPSLAISQGQIHGLKESGAESANLFAETFFLGAKQRVQSQSSEIGGFAFVETPNREWDTRYSVVTDFSGSVLKTKFLPRLKDLKEVRDWVVENLEVAEYQGMARSVIEEYLGPERSKELTELPFGYECELAIQVVPDIVRELAKQNIGVYQVVRYAKTRGVWE